MRARVGQGISVCALLALSALGLAAQAPQKVVVPFKFIANGASYEAGTYYVLPQMGGTRMEIRDERQKPLAHIPVLSRVEAKAWQQRRGTRLLFDEVPGQTRHLSEVWIGGADGYVVRATKEKHTHAEAPMMGASTP